MKLPGKGNKEEKPLHSQKHLKLLKIFNNKLTIKDTVPKENYIILLKGIH
jgi:hypothetical protein